MFTTEAEMFCDDCLTLNTNGLLYEFQKKVGFEMRKTNKNAEWMFKHVTKLITHWPSHGNFVGAHRSHNIVNLLQDFILHQIWQTIQYMHCSLPLEILKLTATTKKRSYLLYETLRMFVETSNNPMIIYTNSNMPLQLAAGGGYNAIQANQKLAAMTYLNALPSLFPVSLKDIISEYAPLCQCVCAIFAGTSQKVGCEYVICARGQENQHLACTCCVGMLTYAMCESHCPELTYCMMCTKKCASCKIYKCHSRCRKTCYSCQVAVCDECRSSCTQCKDRVFCRNCSNGKKCTQCYNATCDFDSETCGLCARKLCKSCGIFCHICKYAGDRFCFTCKSNALQPCMLCQEPLCVDHAVECSICLKMVCPNQQCARPCSCCNDTTRMICNSCKPERGCRCASTRFCATCVLTKQQCSVCNHIVCTNCKDQCSHEPTAFHRKRKAC